VIAARISAAWERLWFAPGSAVNLAAARIVFAGHALWVLLSRDLPALSSLPPAFWEAVVPIDRMRYLIVPGHAGVETALYWLAVVALVAAMLGILPRLSCLGAGLLLYHLAPLETIIWTPDPYERGLTVSVLALITLSASRCGDALAVGKSRRPGSAGGDAAGWEYTWPLRLCQLFLAQVYFFAGWSKIVRAGPGWAAADNIRRWLLVPEQQDQLGIFNGYGSWIAGHAPLCLAIGIGTLALDLAFIAVPFSARLRRLLVPAAAAGHAAIALTMNIFFINLPQLLVFVRWDRIFPRHPEAPAP
jgi:hypothetical protein